MPRQSKIEEAIDYIKQLSLLVATYDNERLKTALAALKTMKWIENISDKKVFEEYGKGRQDMLFEILQYFKEAR